MVGWRWVVKITQSNRGEINSLLLVGRRHCRRIKVVVGSGSAECGRICVTGLDDVGWKSFELELFSV